MDLSAFEANYTPFQFAEEKQKPKASAAKQLAASLLPTIGGALGAVGGSFVAPIAGTVAGGAAGSALGEALRQRVMGEDFSAKKLATEGALGAVPGVFKGAGAGVKALKAGKTAKAATAVEEAATPAARNIKVAYQPTETVGTGVRQTTNNTLTNPSVGELQDALSGMQNRGFSVTQKLGTTKGSPLPSDVGTAPDFTPLTQSPKLPAVALQGQKTAVKFGDTATQTPRAIGTNVADTRASVIANGKRVAGIQDATVSKPVASVPATIEPTASKPTLLSKFSTNATKRGSGIKTDPSVGGIERADEAAATFQRLKIAGTPEQQLRKIGETMTSHSKQVDDILAKNPIALDGAAVKSQVQKAIQDPLKYAELDLTTPGAQRALNAHLDKFAGAKTAKEVNDYVKVINKIAVKAQGKIDRGATLTDKESAALAAKKAGDEVLSQYPEIAPLKKDMAVLFERNGDVTKQSTKTSGIPILGVKSGAVSQGASAVASKTGTAAAKVDAVLQTPTATNAKNVGKNLFSQMATRAVAAPFMAGDQPENIPINQNIPAMTNATTNMPTSSDNMPLLNTESLNNANDPTAGLDAAIQQALASGDYKGLSALMSVADYYSKKNASAKPMSAEASKVVANANSGLDSLSELEGLLQNDPSVLQKTAIPGRAALGGAVGNAIGTASYDTAARNVADVITRLRTGAALTDSEEKFYKSQLPQAFDSPEVVQQKLNMFRNLFSSVSNQTGSTGTDTQALMGAQ